MKYDLIFSTKKKSVWKNTCEMLILHHTAGWNFKDNMEFLANNKAQASAHYVVWQNGEVGKIWEDTDILWQAWTSSWNWKTDLNKYSIWIEIVWPWFTDIQRQRVDELVMELISKYNIKKENLARHKDIAPGRKIDPDDSLWFPRFKTFENYKNYLFNKNYLMWVYEKMFNETYNWKSSVFNDVNGAIEKCINSDWSINWREFFFFTLIWFERTNKK